VLVVVALAVLASGLDRDFCVPFFAFVRYVAPDRASGFDAMIALRLLVRPAIRSMGLFLISHDMTPAGFSFRRSSIFSERQLGMPTPRRECGSPKKLWLRRACCRDEPMLFFSKHCQIFASAGKSTKLMPVRSIVFSAKLNIASFSAPAATKMPYQTIPGPDLVICGSPSATGMITLPRHGGQTVIP
jgi:hypothetical protein